MNPFDIAFQHATPHGVLAAVHLPDSRDPVPAEVLARLHPEEAAHAAEQKGYRQPEFVGGRLALRAAFGALGVRSGPSLPDDRGAPLLPEGYAGSISHKRTLALAMVARADHGTLGVDIEDYGPPRPGIAGKVLVPEELDAIASLPDDRKWIATLLRFSIKEAIYKAIDPYVRRYVGFDEAIVHPDLEGAATVRMQLSGGEGPFTIDARYEWLRGRVLSSVRILPVTDGTTA